VLERGDERLLDRLFGEVEVAELADERREGAAGLLAEDTVDGGARIRGLGVGGSRGLGGRPAQMGSSQIGRTSIAP
jgi:hypothetical protein